MKGVIIVQTLTPENVVELKKGDMVLLFNAEGTMEEPLAFWRRKSPKLIFINVYGFTMSYKTDLSDLAEGFTLRKLLMREQLKFFKRCREVVLALKKEELGAAMLG